MASSSSPPSPARAGPGLPGGQVHLAAGGDALREARAGATLVAGEVSVDVTAQRRQSDGRRDNFDSRLIEQVLATAAQAA